MAMVGHLLSPIIFLSVFSLVFAQSRIRCHPAENDTLSRMQFFTPIAEDGVPDCCSWSSVQCDNATDHVIGLHLYESANNNTLSPHSPIFQLRHLRKLSVDACIYIENPCEIPNEIEKLTALEELSLNFYSGPIPSSIGNLKHLKMLSITDHLSGTIPVSIGNLCNLTSLMLDMVQLNEGSIPSSIGNLHNLTNLYIRDSHLSGNIPAFIGNLLKLTSLSLEMNKLSGSIPASIGNLCNLIELNLRENELSGSIPESIGSLRNLTSLTLDHNKLNGSIPESIGNLTLLENLFLDFNNLSGILPLSIFQFPNLQVLSVWSNSLHGTLPRYVPLDSKLNNLDLSDNLLTGIVPSWVFTGPMAGIRAPGNRFSGIEPFPPPKVSLLYQLDFSNNLIEEIPESLFVLKNVSSLTLDQNRISGALDLSMLKDMENLYFLNISYNEGLSLVNTKGSLPNKLKELYLDHCNITEFPNFLYSMPNLEKLFLRGNKMRGAIDFTKGWDRLFVLDASFNSLEGSLTAPSLSLRYLYLSHNNLIGDVPAEFCKLWELDLSFNRLNGVLRWSSVNSVDMVLINLMNNKLRGSIPEAFFSNLRMLLLNGNNFSGKLPRSLGNCYYLDTLDVGNNNITDKFPGFLGKLTQLKLLVISSNNFMGNIAKSKSPKPWFGLFSSSLVLDISNNKFTGFLPMQYLQNTTFSSDSAFSNYPENGGAGVSISFKGSKALISEILRNQRSPFGILDLSNNQFSGPIPNGIGDLKQLTGLNLSGNQLSGEIPKSIGKLINLESLDISSNMLSGSIPQELLGMKNIGYLNLSNNMLSGPIPKGKYFENKTYVGNVKLCGFPLSKLC